MKESIEQSYALFHTHFRSLSQTKNIYKLKFILYKFHMNYDKKELLYNKMNKQ